MDMDRSNKTDNKNDNRISRVRFPTSFVRWKYVKIMSGIVLVALQILLLLLKAHFNKESDSEKAVTAIREAQMKLAELATKFETKVRYGAPSEASVDRLENTLDAERKANEAHNH